MIVPLLRRPTGRLGLTFNVHLIYQKLIEDKSEVPLQSIANIAPTAKYAIHDTCHVMIPEKEMSDIPP